ncbi:MAG TPA: hypothetical protein VKL19_13135 [Thermoanaerobaculia bacterium]|nr:hypothetical protein [Thermoanaerobaculia bacterium]
MQQLRPDERREFQRLTLNPHIAGTLGKIPVSILEIGVLGARVQHSDALDSEYPELHFSHDGNELAIKCEVIRTSGVKQSGLRFLAAIGESGDRLRDMLGVMVSKEIDRRRTSPGSDPLPSHTVDGDKTVRGADAGFLAFRFENGRWNKRAVFLPEQPSTGFTVSRSSDSGEIQRLCRVYEASDEEGRRLIRLFAELSVSDVLEIPPAVER